MTLALHFTRNVLSYVRELNAELGSGGWRSPGWFKKKQIDKCTLPCTSHACSSLPKCTLRSPALNPRSPGARLAVTRVVQRSKEG